jgi:hypothetical protein
MPCFAKEPIFNETRWSLFTFALLNMQSLRHWNHRQMVHTRAQASVWRRRCHSVLESSVVVWYPYAGWSTSASACIRIPHHTTPPQPNHTVTPTHIEPEQYNPWDKSTISRKLLKMTVITFETCWAVNSEIIKQETSSWSIFIQLTDRNKQKAQQTVVSKSVCSVTSHVIKRPYFWWIVAKGPCAMFRDIMRFFLRWGVFRTLPKPPSWRTTPRRLSATSYLIHS